jgi:hypothetical protein
VPATVTMVCPECDEPVVPRVPNTPVVAGRARQPWSHRDGEPLCPVIGSDGYQPAAPVPARTA